MKNQVGPMPARDEPTRARLVLLDAEVDVPTSLLGAGWFSIHGGERMILCGVGEGGIHGVG